MIARNLFTVVAVVFIVFLLLLFDFHWHGWLASAIPFYAAFVAAPNLDKARVSERREWLEILTVVDIEQEHEIERVLHEIRKRR